VKELNISFANNRIALIGDYAFNFEKVQNPYNSLTTIIIDLTKNHLNDKSFAKYALNISEDFVVELNLSSNNLTHLDEFVFKQFLESDPGNKLIVSDNYFICDCRSKWILKKNYKIKGMYCQTHELFIHVLDESDLIKCQSYTKN